jgi:glutathione synthase/RimK-type ligase-like ATP-grasp enzyme
VLGDTVEEIAVDKLQIGRPESPLFTTSAQSPEVRAVIARGVRERDIQLHTVHEDRVEGPGGVVTDSALEIDMAGRPASFAENARLATVVARHLTENALPEATAREIVQAHRWPGRFEIAGRDPLVVLDGAHNPAAARSLVGDLAKLSERWHFVVGTSIGHDSSGILEAIAPAAKSVLLTRSSHPRATPIEALKAATPSALNGRVSTCPSLGLDALQSDAPLCVMGSLHLVARARELLDLPLERDTFTEDLHRESLHCLEQACGKLGLPIAPASNNGNVVKVTADGRPLYFMRNKHPFNDYVTARLAEDKAYQFELFTQASLPVPKTLQIFNPLADARFDEYRTHASVDEVVVGIEGQLDYPVVVKRNQGSLAQGVFLCEDRQALHDRVKELCENSGFFDNILLIQAFVRGREFRAVASRDEMLLGYEKVLDDEATGDLNPLHGAGGEAVPVADRSILDPMRDITRRVSGVLDLGFYAIDLILGDTGFVILEVNPNPICFFYNQCNGRADFTRIYERLITKFVLGTA